MATSYSVEAVLRAVDKGFTSTMRQAQAQLSALSKFSGGVSDRLGKLSDGMVNTGQSMTKYFTTPIAGGVVTAIKSFGDLEQAYGGIETMFKNSASTVIQNAQQAYKTAGVSSVQYMEQVTSFSARLLQGLGDDTAKAAAYADTAVRDMADNANKFGTSMSEIQNAYQNFAKGNFVLLDNLKLGYGGTQAEMARLVNESGVLNGEFEATAENVKDIPFDKLIEAIHVTQEKLGITGTTAEEASKTVNGSFYQMLAAGKNLASGLGDNTADIKQLMSNLQESVQTFGGNIGRVLKTMWDNIPLSNAQKSLGALAVATGPLLVAFGKVGQAMSWAMRTGNDFGGAFSTSLQIASGAFGFLQAKAGAAFAFIGAKFTGLTKLTSLLPASLSGVTSTFGASFGLMSNILTTFSGLAIRALLPATIFGAFLVGLGLLQNQFGEQINQMANIAITQGPTVITNFINGIVSKIPELINQGTQLVQTLTDVIVANAPAIFQGAVALITALVQGVGNNATQLIGSAIQIIGVLVNGLLTALPQLLSVGMQFLVQLAQGVVNNIPLILSTAQDIILNFINSVSENLPSIIQSGIQIIVTLVQGVIDNLPQIIQTAITIIGALLKGIASALPQIVVAGFTLIAKLAGALITNAPQILQAGWDLITGLGKAMLEAIPQALQGVRDGIKNGFSSVWNWVTGKNTEGAETTKAKITETATTVSTETARMANDASVNATAMSTNMQSILDQLVANTNLQTGQMATDVGTQTSIMSDNAIANATTMTDGVNQSVAGINLDGLASIEQFSLNTAQNFATANQNATTQAQAINTNVSAQMDATAQSGQGAMTNFSNSVSSEMNKASQLATQSANQMNQAVTQSFDKMRTAASNVMSSLNNGFTSGMSKMVSTVAQSGNKMKSTFQSTFNAIKAQTNSAMSNLQSRFSSGMNQVISLSQQAGSRVVQIFQSVAGRMQSAGYFAGMGFYNGLAGSAGAIYSLAASIANTVASTIRSALSIHSPSRVMRAIGGFTGEGMAIGMADWVPKIAKVSEKMAEVAMPDVAPIDMTATLKGNVKAVEQSLHSTLEVKQDKERQPIELVFDFGRRAFSAFVEDIFEEHDKQERIQVRMRPI